MQIKDDICILLDLFTLLYKNLHTNTKIDKINNFNSQLKLTYKFIIRLKASYSSFFYLKKINKIP